MHDVCVRLAEEAFYARSLRIFCFVVSVSPTSPPCQLPKEMEVEVSVREGPANRSLHAMRPQRSASVFRLSVA